MGAKTTAGFIFFREALVARTIAFDASDMTADRLIAEFEPIYGKPGSIDRERFKAIALPLVASEADIDAGMDTEAFENSFAFSTGNGVYALLVAEPDQITAAWFAEEMIETLRAQAEAEEASQKPYSEEQARDVLRLLACAYADALQQYDDIASMMLWASAWDRDWLDMQRDKASARSLRLDVSREEAVSRLDALLDSGDVMPWSGIPMDREEALELIELYEKRDKDYAQILDWYETMLDHYDAREEYGADFLTAFDQIVSADADICIMLNRLVLEPHLTAAQAQGQNIAAECFDLIDSVELKNRRVNDIEITDRKLLKDTLAAMFSHRREQFEKLEAICA